VLSIWKERPALRGQSRSCVCGLLRPEAPRFPELLHQDPTAGREKVLPWIIPRHLVWPGAQLCVSVPVVFVRRSVHAKAAMEAGSKMAPNTSSTSSGLPIANRLAPPNRTARMASRAYVMGFILA